MFFDLKTYSKIIEYLLDKGFEFTNFNDYSKVGKVYLRHDIDVYIEGVIDLATIEFNLGVSSTWFFLPDGEFYNPLSKQNINLFRRLYKMGHKIGLHIDASKFENYNELREYIVSSIKYFSNFFPVERVISFHRPSKQILESNIKFEGIVNTYSKEFFKDIIYISDSKRREFYDILVEKVSIEKNKSIQLLIHPYWWGEKHLDIFELKERLIEKKMEQLNQGLINNVKLYEILIKEEIM